MPVTRILSALMMIDEVAGVHVRGVLRLVLALQKGSGLGGNTAEDLILSVDDVPFALNFDEA